MTLRDEELARIARGIAEKIFQEAETKRIIKEAFQEWMDRKLNEFERWTGRWAMRAIAVAFVAAFVTFILWTQGYHK